MPLAICNLITTIFKWQTNNRTHHLITLESVQKNML